MILHPIRRAGELFLLHDLKRLLDGLFCRDLQVRFVSDGTGGGLRL